MPRQKLNQILESLHQQLAEGTLDDVDRTHLVEVLQEIQQVLDVDKPSSPLVERIGAFVQRLDSEHPALSAALGEAIQTLKRL